MPISVICPGCHSRFKVSDKFAGKTGPCPKCKKEIQVPAASEEVVIHVPEHSEGGARDSSGKSVLKPIERLDQKAQPIMIAGIAAVALVVFLVALALRFSSGGPTPLMLAVGAVLLGPPLSWAGFGLLRNDEDLDPFHGASLWIRSLVSGLIYAALWMLYTYMHGRFFGTDPVEVFNVFMIGGPFLLIGACTAFFTFDFDLLTGFFHYAFYLLVTVLLRLTMGLPPL